MRVEAKCENCAFYIKWDIAGDLADGTCAFNPGWIDTAGDHWCGKFDALERFDYWESQFSKARPSVIWPTNKGEYA